MGVTNFNKELTATQINCGQSFNVRLSLTAEPDITSNPTDIVLILDRSGSMAGSAITNLKEGAKAFVDIITQATGGTIDGEIQGGSRIGVVSFADIGVQDTQLITSSSDLKTAIDALSAGGSTNHEDAFTKALDLFDDVSTNAKVMVMFTDGFTTTGGDANAITTLAKSQGVIIYVIGLSGNGGVDVPVLEGWASSPASSYVAITPDDAELADLFEDLAENIVNPGATNIVITDTVIDCFRITSITSPTKGTATLLDMNTIEWRIDELGVTASEGAVLEFTVQHIGTCSGEVEINESITYTDTEGNVVNFPSPTLNVDCDIIVNPEECPTPVDIAVDTCSDSIVFDAGDLVMESLGRIVQLDVTLKNICPNKRVALAVILNEVDDNGIEHKRGLKTMTIPAHTRETCQDVLVRCIKFVLPEDLSTIDVTDSICPSRNLKARFICHYIDNDFFCCDEVE
ncbi:MAG: VWA domain-containing protein [Clostridiales bacterium]|nr:VWA domain-containing protein [Clostridiales bacterium]